MFYQGLCTECSIKLNYNKKHKLSEIRKEKSASHSTKRIKTESEETSQELLHNDDVEKNEDNLWRNNVSQNNDLNVDQKIETYLSELF